MDVEREQNNTHGGNENKGKENATVSVPLWVERMTQWSVGEAYPSNASMSNETIKTELWQFGKFGKLLPICWHTCQIMFLLNILLALNEITQ